MTIIKKVFDIHRFLEIRGTAYVTHVPPGEAPGSFRK